jgi:N-acetylglutamate synthase-like GNAT family acetyltransferase
MDINAIHAYLSRSYWAENIPYNIVKKSIENSLCFGVFYNVAPNNNEQVGFARIITDSATFAYLADVYILEEHRGNGLSKNLLEKITAHSSLQGLRRIMLATSDAHSLYEQFGFKQISSPQMFMELCTPNIYNNSKYYS